jgi:hypothetical protein
MKRMLLLLVSLLLISNAASADHIGVYSDASGASCSLGNANVFNPTATVIQKFTTGATGSRFKVNFPSGTMFFGFNTPYVPVGTLTVDLSVGYGQCLSGSIVLGTINAIYGAGTGQVLPADLQQCIIYTNCLFAEIPATGGSFAVGGFSNCNGNSGCTVAVEPSTWGNVKSLYR